MISQRQVIHIAREPYTGVWSMMRQLATWQHRNGYKVALGLLLSSSWPRSYREQADEMARTGIGVMIAKSPDIFGTAAILFHSFHNPFAKWVRKLSGDGLPVILHFHNAWLSGAYLPVRAANAATVVTYHGIQGERAPRRQPVRRRIHANWARSLVKHGTRHVSVDKRNTFVAENLFGVPASLFTVIPNGTRAPEGLNGCPRLTDSSRPFTVGHVGSLDSGKGWDITAAAVKSLHAQGHAVRYLIAGDGPDAAAAEIWCRQNRACAAFLGHHSNPIANVFPLLDALSLPSVSEGLPMAVLEAFSLGIPVITTGAGGLSDVIENGRNGLLVDRSPEAVAGALSILMKDYAKHSAMSRAAKADHARMYSASAMGEAYDGLYRLTC